jgi:hypothetical protein
MKTPIQKAFTDYVNNKYWVPQSIAFLMFIMFLSYSREFESTFDIVLMLIPICGAFFVPFIILFVWAYQYKKGTRK